MDRGPKSFIPQISRHRNDIDTKIFRPRKISTATQNSHVNYLISAPRNEEKKTKWTKANKHEKGLWLRDDVDEPLSEILLLSIKEERYNGAIRHLHPEKTFIRIK